MAVMATDMAMKRKQSRRLDFLPKTSLNMPVNFSVLDRAAGGKTRTCGLIVCVAGSVFALKFR
jgi:hypothetical protein